MKLLTGNQDALLLQGSSILLVINPKKSHNVPTIIRDFKADLTSFLCTETCKEHIIKAAMALKAIQNSNIIHCYPTLDQYNALEAHTDDAELFDIISDAIFASWAL